MIITDYSQQSFHSEKTDTKLTIKDILSASLIIIVPVIFLLIIAA